MCGITGLFDTRGRREFDRALLVRMNNSQAHRGPDGEGYHLEPGVALGHRRLSIIDIATGQQPLFNEDGSVGVVFNGEIYNFQALIPELQALGHVFRTKSDTEVIVHAWEAWGEDCVQRLRGMFAFAIWDRNRQCLFMARDRLGVKPLYYALLDDGTLPDRRGSLNVDDEGHASQRNVLIEDGILRGYIQDSLNARLMGVKATGNGRRESYAHLPMPRMTNTYMLAGERDPAEIVASIQRGLYATNFGGGQVDITSGKFVFSASEAFWVENGKVLYPVKGATIIGNGPEAMTRVSMIGNDLQLDTGVGVCGKEGQSVPVGVGQPTLRIDGLTVGGTG